MALRSKRVPSGRTNLGDRPATSSDLGRRGAEHLRSSRAQSPFLSPVSDRNKTAFENQSGQAKVLSHKKKETQISRPHTSQGAISKRVSTGRSIMSPTLHVADSSRRQLHTSASSRRDLLFSRDGSQRRPGPGASTRTSQHSRTLGQSASSPALQRGMSGSMWHPELDEDHNPWDAGLDTQRIAHELEWDDQQNDEEGMTSARLARAKAFAVHHFITQELDPLTVKVTPELQGLSEEDLIHKFNRQGGFAKNLREMKYRNRRMVTKNSDKVHDCLSLPEVNGVHATQLFDVNEVDAKPYSAGIFGATSSGVRSFKELKHRRNQESLAAGAAWLAKDETYTKPGVSFKRVAAYTRDTYVTR